VKRLVIIGAGGRLGAALVREYAGTFDVAGFNHAQLDLAAPEQMRAALSGLEFDALINTAAQTNVDRCETHHEEAFAINGEAPGVLAEICAGKKARFIHISTDYVFDGEKREPYTEADEAEPISVYGESKRAGERRAIEVNERALVVRVSWVFGPDRPSFIDWAVNQAREHEEVKAIADKWATPTYTLDLAQMLKAFFSDDDPAYSGIIHLANTGECSWQEYAQWALPHGRNSDEGPHDWRVVARGDEKLHRETAGLQRALEREIRGADWSNATPLAGSGKGLRARLREIATRTSNPPTFRRPFRAPFISETIYPEFRYASLRALILRGSGVGQRSAIRLSFSAERAHLRSPCSQVSDSNLSRSACSLRRLASLPRSRKPNTRSATRVRNGNTCSS
jgi:dTDP-4-dehydrorhamnose reductase